MANINQNRFSNSRPSTITRLGDVVLRTTVLQRPQGALYVHDVQRANGDFETVTEYRDTLKKARLIPVRTAVPTTLQR